MKSRGASSFVRLQIVPLAMWSALGFCGCGSHALPTGPVDAAAHSDLADAALAPSDLAIDLSIPDLADAATASDLGAADGGSNDASSDAGDTDGPAVLAPTGDTDQVNPVDGIQCQVDEQLLFHTHAHLQIYVNGEQRLLAPGIGIGAPLQIEDGFVVGGSCFSWLHTHDDSGIIHIESPIARAYTLGNFFDIWGQPLAMAQVGPAKGMVTAWLNGMPFVGDITTIPLVDHYVIQLDVGAPVIPVQPYVFPPGY